MPGPTQTMALAVANLTLVAFAVALLVGLAWLLIATIRHHAGRAAKRLERQQFHAAAQDAADTNDGNELRHIDLSSVDLDAELLQLTEGGESK